MTMTPEIKANWVAALRSGEYTQGQETMYQEGDKTHCCLGVLRHMLNGNNDIPDGLEEEDNGVDMPTAAELQAWGLAKNDADKLAVFNDGIWDYDNGRQGKRMTFAGIASYIEGRKTL